MFFFFTASMPLTRRVVALRISAIDKIAKKNSRGLVWVIRKRRRSPKRGSDPRRLALPSGRVSRGAIKMLNSMGWPRARVQLLLPPAEHCEMHDFKTGSTFTVNFALVHVPV